jgi:uncharacterized membrane protein
MPLRRTVLPLLALLLLGAPLYAGVDGESAAVDAAASTGSWPWMLFGRLHVLTVHFPIALLTIVLVVESLRWLRKRTAPDPTLTVITVFAALSAVVATVMGWAQASCMEFSGREAEIVTVHRWLGVATAAISLVVAALALSLQLLNRPSLRTAYLASLAVVVLGVSVAGHYGGMLVHGETYVLDPLPPWLGGRKPKIAYAGPTKDKPGAPVDFAREVEPLFKKVCYECHDEDKQKGDLRMDTREDLLKGGASGAAVVPGDPAKSVIIQRVLGEGDDAGKPKPQMPKKHDPLTKEQIDLLERWVAQGAAYAPAAPAAPAKEAK